VEADRAGRPAPLRDDKGGRKIRSRHQVGGRAHVVVLWVNPRNKRRAVIRWPHDVLERNVIQGRWPPMRAEEAEP